jgi:hypothetical protein
MDLRTALWFEWAYIAVKLAGAIQKRLAFMYGAACPKLLAAGAIVDVVGPVILKVAAREGAIIPLRFVEHGDVWRDALLLDQPVQHRSRTVSCIPDKPLRLEAEAHLCSLNHGLCRPTSACRMEREASMSIGVPNLPPHRLPIFDADRRLRGGLEA